MPAIPRESTHTGLHSQLEKSWWRASSLRDPKGTTVPSQPTLPWLVLALGTGCAGTLPVGFMCI